MIIYKSKNPQPKSNDAELHSLVMQIRKACKQHMERRLNRIPIEERIKLRMLSNLFPVVFVRWDTSKLWNLVLLYAIMKNTTFQEPVP